MLLVGSQAPAEEPANRTAMRGLRGLLKPKPTSVGEFALKSKPGPPVLGVDVWVTAPFRKNDNV